MPPSAPVSLRQFPLRPNPKGPPGVCTSARCCFLVACLLSSSIASWPPPHPCPLLLLEGNGGDRSPGTLLSYGGNVGTDCERRCTDHFEFCRRLLARPLPASKPVLGVIFLRLSSGRREAKGPGSFADRRDRLPVGHRHDGTCGREPTDTTQG